MKHHTFDVIVIGAGAAGMLCAALAGQRGRKVLVIDHARHVGEKIRISGGGKCNFTNRTVSAEHYLSRNPHFCRSALARYGPQDFLALLKQHGIAWQEREHGQLFCAHSAQDLIAMLVRECDNAAVQWALDTHIESIRSDIEARRYFVASSRGPFEAHSLVIATGGLAVPKTGASDFGYRIAQQFGLPVVDPLPALVPLSLPPEELSRFAPLAGVSLEIEAEAAGPAFREAALLTHRGLSGPAILQASSYWQAQHYEHQGRRPQGLRLNLLPGQDAEAWLDQRADSRMLLANQLAEILPRKFAHAWCVLHGWTQPLQQTPARERRRIAAALAEWELEPSGTLGHTKAEVTLGGVDTRALSSKTMESLQHPGLFFIGEVVDVTGHLGGYNFQWAWSSAHAAAQAV